MSDEKSTASNRWRKKIPSGPITLEEYESFQRRHREVWAALIVVAAYALSVALLDKLSKNYRVDISGLVIVLGILLLVICTIVAILRFRCPRCGVMPTTKAASFSDGAATYGKYVALRPKSCGTCGVQFARPHEDNSSSQVTEASH